MMKWGPLWKFVLVVVLAGVALGALDRYTSFDLLGASELPPALTPDWEALAEARVWERSEPSKTEATPTPSPTHTPTPRAAVTRGQVSAGRYCESRCAGERPGLPFWGHRAICRWRNRSDYRVVHFRAVGMDR